MSLELRNISLNLGKNTLFHAFNLTISGKGLYAILGPNGAGKTTLLRLLSGQHPPQTGQAFIDGQDLSRLSAQEKARLLAMVSPREPLPGFPMRVEEYLMLGRLPYQDWLGTPRSEDHEKIASLCTSCAIETLKGKWVEQLSSGEWQKVQIARALAQEPQWLFLDEPTSHLDVPGQMRILKQLQELQSQGTRIVLILHDINLAYRFASEALLLKQGQIIAEGKVSQVLTPQHLETLYGIPWEVIQAKNRTLLIPLLENTTQPA